MHAHAAPRAEWSLEQHTSSGLLQRVRDSGVSVADAEAAVLAFARAHAPPNTLVLAGNSVGMDKRFIDRYMPELAAYLRHQARAAAAAVGPHPAAPLRRCAAAPPFTRAPPSIPRPVVLCFGPPHRRGAERNAPLNKTNP
jgi:hypothetical protein